MDIVGSFINVTRRTLWIGLSALLVLSSLVPTLAMLGERAEATPVSLFANGFEDNFASWTANSGPVSAKNDVAAQEGSKYALFDGTANATLKKDIAVGGHSSLELSFYYQQSGLDSGDSFSVVSDYGTFTEQIHHIAGENSSSDDVNTWTKVTKSVSLPVSGTLKLVFESDFNTDGDHLLIDNVVLSGSPIASTPEITSVDAALWTGGNYKGINVDITVDKLTTATGVSVAVNRTTGGAVTKTNKPTGSVLATLNTGNVATVSAPIVIQEGTYSEAASSSWNPAPATWTAATVPESVTVTITRSDGAPITKTVPVTTNLATYESLLPAPSAPEITNVSAEYVQHSSPDYTGVWVDFKEKGITTATDVELRLNRADGSHYSIHALSSVLSAVNAGTAEYETGGTVIITGSRTSSSWSPQVGTWTGSSPLKTNDPVEVIITLQDGTKLSKTVALESQIRNQSIENDVFPADTVGPEVSNVMLNGKSVNIARDVNCGPTDFNLVNGKVDLSATITDGSGVKSAKYKIRKVTTGGCTQTNIYQSGTVNMSNQSGDSWVTLPGAKLDTADVPTDGTYTIQMTVEDSLGNTATKYVDIFVDRTAPTAPTITSPTARQWFKTTPIKATWNPATDVNGISHYQIAYHYDDNHTFGGSTCSGEVIDGKTVSGCRDVNGTTRNHQPADWEQGGVTIWVRAIDNAGNVGPWSKSVHYYYDHEAPNTDINVSPVVDGKFTVSGDASDNLALNRVYVQLVSRVSNQRCGGVTINLIPEGANANWSQTYDIANLFAVGTTNLCPEGDYAAHVSVTDMAGNSSTAGWTANFAVHAPQPVVAGTQFSTYSDGVWEGIYTEFDFTGFQTVTGVTVSLYDETGDLITRNTHTQDLLDLIANNGLTAISSPFVINDINYPVDPYWNFNVDGYTWTDTSPKPAKVVFQVTGTDYFGDPVTLEDELNGLVESTWTFANILPDPVITPQGSTGGPQVQGASTNKPNKKSGNLAVTAFGNTQNLSTETNGTSEGEQNEEKSEDSESEDENAEEVAAANTENTDNKETTGATGGSGISWWWVIPVVTGLGFGTYYFAYARREQ